MNTRHRRSTSIVAVATVLLSLGAGIQPASAQTVGPVDLGVVRCGAPNNSGMMTCGSVNWLTNETHAFLWTQADGLTDLGSLGGTSASAVALNDSGMVVGSSSLTTGDTHAFIWTRATGMTDLGTLGGSASSAVAVNSDGMVAGNSSLASGETHAFVWTRDAGMTDLGTLGGTSSSAVALNTTGMVVGNSSLAAAAGATPKTHAFAWTQASGIVDLGSIGDNDSRAQAVNDGGMVLGTAAPDAFPGRHGFVWTQATGIVDLTLPGDNDSIVIALNQAGMVVGQSSGVIFTDGGVMGTQRGFAWTQGNGITDLGTLGYSGSYPHTWVSAVNGGGMVVGYSGTATGTSHAFAWTLANGMTDLGSLGGISLAAAVNDHGLVVGFFAPVEGVFQFRAFAWTEATGMIDLGTLTGSSDTRASFVNNDGLVVGSSRLPNYEDHAVWWNVSSLEDNTAPTLSLPAAITADATSPSGAVVTFTATASDPDDTAGPVTCLPTSGALFPIGTTTVTCSATDTHGNSVSGEFVVTVLSAAQIVSHLISTVVAAGFQQAGSLLSASAATNTKAVCNQLAAFINQVQAQAGKQLPGANATELIQSAANARAALACP